MKILLIIPTLCFLTSCDQVVVDKEKLKKCFQESLEKAYFEGQKDYSEGDIRIEFDKKNNCWRATRSFWDDGTRNIFDPSGVKVNN